MDAAQPALLYIVPMTVIPIGGLALCRGDFHDFWHGDPLEMEDDEKVEEGDEEEENCRRMRRESQGSLNEEIPQN